MIIKIMGFFLAILVLLSGFFEIDRIPIKTYFLVRKMVKIWVEYKNENWVKFGSQIL